MTFIVPETADLERVRAVLQAIRDELSPHDVSGLSARQTSYALHTALALSLVARSGQEHVLAAKGREFLSLRWGSDEAKAYLSAAVRTTDLFKAIP